MSDRSLQLEVPLILFLILSWLTVSLRCYVRIYMVKNFAIDDYFILATLLSFTVYCGLAIASVSWGTGKHMADLTVRQQWNAMKMWHFCEFFYPISTTCLRLSAGFFLLRITVKKSHRYIIHTLNVANVIIGLYLWFVNLFQCKPIDYWWTRVDGKHIGECHLLLSADTIYIQSAVTAVIDWTFGLLPIFIIWDLQMNTRKKILVGLILSLAAMYVPRLEAGHFVSDSFPQCQYSHHYSASLRLRTRPHRRLLMGQYSRRTLVLRRTRPWLGCPLARYPAPAFTLLPYPTRLDRPRSFYDSRRLPQ